MTPLSDGGSWLVDPKKFDSSRNCQHTLTRHHNDSMAQSIAKSIALPGKTSPVRFPSYPALERTALMGFNASLGAKINTSNTHYMLSRQAALPLWGDYQAVGGADQALTWGVSYVLTAFGPGNPGSALPAIYSEVTDQIGAWHQSTNYGVSNPTRNVPGGDWPTTFPVIGVDAGTTEIPWVYAPKGSKLIFSTNAQNFKYDAVIQLETWVSPGQTLPIALSGVISSGAINQAAGGQILVARNSWYRVKGVAYTDLSGAILQTSPTVSLGCVLSDLSPAFTTNATTGVWSVSSANDTAWYFLPLTVSPEFSNSVLPWLSTRLNAVAALFTNTTKVLNKEGTVLWGRTNPVLYDPFNVTYSTLQGLHPAEKAFMDLEHGCYAYNPPSTDLANFYTYALNINSLGINAQWLPLYRLDNPAFTAQAYFTDPDGGTNLAINLDYHTEFRTSSTLFQIGVSSMPLETLHMAQVALLKAGFFFSNFDHTEMISKIIKFIGSMHPLLSVGIPMANGLMQAASVAISNRPTAANRPVATSGQGAGIVSRSAPQRARKARVATRRPRKPAPRPAPRRTAPVRGRNGLRKGLDMYLEANPRR